MVRNQYQQNSTLSLTVAHGKDRDYLQSVSFTAPFKITKPFYGNRDWMRVMVLSVSAGIMAGDTQQIDVDVCPNVRVQMDSQSYEKIHKMPMGEATRQTKLTVQSEGRLIYSPLPTIPFADSAFTSDTEIFLADQTARLCYSEILSCGRAGCGERFAYRFYGANTKVYVGNRLAYFDNAWFEPSTMELEGFCAFEGYSHLFNLVLFHWGEESSLLKQIREWMEQLPEVQGGASLMGCGAVCVRALANSSEILLQLQQKIVENLQAIS